MQDIRSPLQAQVVQWLVAAGDAVAAGDVLVILEAMKMEHEIRAPHAGCLAELYFQAGETVGDGDVLGTLAPLSEAVASAVPDQPQHVEPLVGPAERADLKKLQDRLAFTQDAQRPEAVAKRHALGLRTARENIAELCDPDSFVEYGSLAVAAQSRRRSADDLMRNTPADGMVTGIGSIHGQRVVVMAYDFTVLAGTQGMRNHQKTDRLLGVALQNKLPVVLFAEGGGGRPGDVDVAIVAVVCRWWA
jgi:pyruvate/2-oxoglutarate dehydrogenase complex dihydrolipoamide acyltransferase (E2) component